jgi:hypothetical protein
MNFENAFLGSRFTWTATLIQRSRWPPRVLCWHSSSPPWPCAQHVAAAARRNATAAHEGDRKRGRKLPPAPPELWEPLGSAPSRALPTPGLELADRRDDAWQLSRRSAVAASPFPAMARSGVVRMNIVATGRSPI